MRKIRLLLTFIILWQLAITAQNKYEFGQLSKAEIEMSSCEFDGVAEACVLFDIGKSYFNEVNEQFEVVFERTTRIKIFNEAGIKYAQIEIPYYNENRTIERISDIEAYTYNFENGIMKKMKLSEKDCYDEKLNEFWMLRKFAMPAVHAGSIIEYKYQIRSPFKFNLRDWEFQTRIPVIYSRYQVNLIPFYEYSWLLQGANSFNKHVSYVEKELSRQFGPVIFNDMVHIYEMEKVQAFRDEQYISSINDYIIKLDFQLSKIHNTRGATTNVLTTWEDLVKSLTKNSDFGKYVNKSNKSAKKIFNLDSLLKLPPLQRFNHVVTYVKQNYNWNNYYGKYTNKSVSNFIKDKNGSVAEINLFLVGLLQACELEAYPIILSTRQNGKIKYNYPYVHFFNYVIAYAVVNGQIMLADASETTLPNDRIPIRALNDKGLIVNKGEIQWLELKCEIPSETRTDIAITFDKEEQTASVRNTFSEYDAYFERQRLLAGKEKIIEELKKKNYEITEEELTFKNFREIEQNFIIQFNHKAQVENIGEKIYVAPFLAEALSENPLKQNTRTLPIDMLYPFKHKFTSTIDIPTGHKLDFTPQDMTVKNDLFEMTYSVQNVQNKVQVYFYFFFKKPVYQSNDFSKLKFYFNELVKKGNEKIVFSKI